MKIMAKAAVGGWVACALAFACAAPAEAYLPQSWNGWKWARSGNLAIQLGDNVSSVWDPYLSRAASIWSANSVIDFKMAAGKSTSALTCNPSYGTVQACNANYGATGWLGLAQVWTSGGYIVQATVKLNDYYYSQSAFNTTAYRQMVSCQEVGHTLGLNHSDTIMTNLNLGSCMDYTNDPTGTKGTNGTRANITASSSDLYNLSKIYATPGGTQISLTKPTYMAMEAFYIDGHEDHEAVPEPATWAMMLAGFGLAGAGVRRRKLRAVHA
jgi:hypothetical protein